MAINPILDRAWSAPEVVNADAEFNALLEKIDSEEHRVGLLAAFKEAVAGAALAVAHS